MTSIVQIATEGSPYATFASTVTPGNLIVVINAQRDNTASPTSPPGFTLMDTVVGNISGNMRRISMWKYTVTADPTENTLLGDGKTYQSSQASDRLSAIELAGVDAGITAAGFFANTTGDLDCGGPVTPTAGSDIILIGAWATDGGPYTITPAAGYTAYCNAFTTPTQWAAYREVASASGSYTVSGNSGISGGNYVGVTAVFLAAASITPPDPGTIVEWDGEVFTTERVKEWVITRGAPPELTGGSTTGQATITLINTPDDRYNPENTGGDLYGMLVDGPRVWIGVNEDGTIEPDPLKDIYGLFAGRITDISVLPEPGATVAPFVELVCEDPLAWLERQTISLPDSTERSQAQLRLEILLAAGQHFRDVPAEPTTLPLSRADGSALRALEAINNANGTRHFAKPADETTTWYTYTAVRRVDGLDGTSDASVDAGAEHVTDTSGWRRSADGVINQQKASVEPISFPGRVLVWQPDALPFTVTGTQEIWTQFGDYVGDPEVDIDFTGSALTATLEPFGDTAKLTLVSAGTSSVTSLDIFGHLVQRGSVESVVIDDTTSQAGSRGIRAGSELSGDYLGTLSTAKGFAQHIVWRFGNPLYRPTMKVVNWMPEQFDLDLFDRIAFTSSQLKVDARIFEIVGLTHHGVMAALENDNPVVYHETTYVLQESRVQEATQWFTTDVSTSDGPDKLAY